ncbi:MAG: M14 family zinc carboxypeptidase [Bacteroidia bacterium]|nr:M14 family zinc carboxypeptidase [Bacteroidia bacterium]
MVRLSLIVVLLIFSFGRICGQAVYSLVSLSPTSQEEWQNWLDAGLAVDHFHSHNGNLEVVLDSAEITLLDELGATYSILQHDLAAVYARALPVQAQNLSQRAACGLNHFSPGSMSGYHTWAEAIAQLDSMHANFPTLISPKIAIGTSVEGRTIWAAKISDHPTLDESSSEAGVYFDALTHAREPLSLEAILYYMWWLLENYNNNPEATYLINKREIFFVPVVNPDGYVYNQTTNPNGGGLWRKNRRITNTICSGIDLNRNFGFGWGVNTGSTDDPCSNTFRGISAFSEPETQAIQNYLSAVSPEVGFSIHAYGQKILSPLGYLDSLVQTGLYSDMASEFIPERYNGYGTAKQLFNYLSSGTTVDYFHNQGMKGWLPEIGNDFWDDPGTICFRLREFLPAMKYITWGAGAFVRYQDYEYEELIPGKNTTLSLRVRNKGLSQIANNVSVSLLPLNPGVQVNTIGTNAGFSILPGRETVAKFSIDISPATQYMDTVRLAVITGFDGIITDRDTLQLFVGRQEILFEDNFDSGAGKWQKLGTGISWDTTSLDRLGGKNYITDSPRGSYRYDSNTGIVTSTFVDLTSAVNPVLEFSARYSLEPFQDYVKIEAGNLTSPNWKTLGGTYSTTFDGNFYYHGNRHWVNEKIDLSEFVGQKIKIRFQLHSGNFVQSDGFYLGDFRIVDYLPSVTGVTPGISEPVFEIFPNPAQDHFFIRLTASKPENTTLEISDILGKIVWTEKEKTPKPGENEWEINTRSFSPGIYIVKGLTENGVQVKQVLIQ